MTSDTKTDRQARRAKLLDALPASIRALPSMTYKRREAENNQEYYSDVEYGVKTTRDLAERFAKRYPEAADPDPAKKK